MEPPYQRPSSLNNGQQIPAIAITSGPSNNRFLNPSRPKITITMPKMYTDGTFPINPQSPYYQTATGELSANIGGSLYHPDNIQGTPTWPQHIANARAGDFMFKHLEGFRDFTMSTAKSGLSGGEKLVFWMYEKFSRWSKKWFTHIFLFIMVLLYSFAGASLFVAIEGEYLFSNSILPFHLQFALALNIGMCYRLSCLPPAEK